MALKKSDFEIDFVDDELNRQIERAMKRNPVQTVKAVRTIALDLSSKSARRAPVESGDLRNNCSAELNDVTVFENKKAVPGFTAPATEASVSVGYSLPYALRQHEELRYRHDRTDGYTLPDGRTINKKAGGEAKFLERPFNENEAAYVDKIYKIVENSFK